MSAPWLARWTSLDPLCAIDGWNRYAFVRGSPLTLRDPTGTQTYPAEYGFQGFVETVVKPALAHPSMQATLGVLDFLEQAGTGLVQTLSHPVASIRALNDQMAAGYRAEGAVGLINTVNPVYHMLVSGDAAAEAWRRGDYRAATRNALSTVGHAVSTVGLAVGGAKLVAGRAPPASRAMGPPSVHGGGGTVSVFHGSIDNGAAILRSGLDPGRAPTFVSRDLAAAKDALMSHPNAVPGLGTLIESQIPSNLFQKSLAPLERPYSGFYPYRLTSTEITLRTIEQIQLFNQYIVR